MTPENVLLLETFKKNALEGHASGIYLDVPDDVYHHRDFPGMSGSKLSKIRDSIYTYIYDLNHEKDETDALAFGRAFHSAILTPEIFKSDYVFAPEFSDGRTTKGKEERKEFAEANKGKSILSKKDHDVLMGMMQECHSNEKIVELLKDGNRELTMLWNKQDVLCKGKLDLIRDKDLLIADFKTAESCKLPHFKKDLIKWYYAAKAAMYLDGAAQVYEREFFYFVYVVIEKKPPHNLALYILDKATIETGRRLYMEDLQKYIDYMNAENKNIFKPKNFVIAGLDKWQHEL